MAENSDSFTYFLLCPCGLKSAYELLKVTDNLSFIKNSFPIHISTEILSSEFYFLRCITNSKSLFDNCTYCLLVLIQEVRLHWKKDREILSWNFQFYVFKKWERGVHKLETQSLRGFQRTIRQMKGGVCPCLFQSIVCFWRDSEDRVTYGSKSLSKSSLKLGTGTNDSLSSDTAPLRRETLGQRNH